MNVIAALICTWSVISGIPLHHQSYPDPDPLYHLQRRSSRGLPKPEDESNTDGSNFEFDMVLTPYQKFVIHSQTGPAHPSMAWKRKALIDVARRWPKAVIPFELSPSLNPFQLQWALRAMESWSNSTCIKFSAKTPELSKSLGHDDFVLFTNGSSCRTMVGRVPGGQDLVIGDSCSLGSIAHELGHTIGFVHEQSRPDRDLNVDIIKDNIIPTREEDFKKYTAQTISTYNLPYDYNSIMHYSSTAFSKNGGLTVRTHDPHLQMVIGQRSKLSFLDIKLANEVYKCNDHCTTKITCNNGGYLGPACTCVCPEGLTGSTCDKLSTNGACGGVLSATSGSVQTPDYPIGYPQDTDCYWLIQGPPNSNIVLSFSEFDVDDGYDCQWCNCDYLELKTYGFEKAGQRYCGDYVKTPLLHNSSSLLLHFHTDDTWSMNVGFKFAYKILSS